MRHIIIESPYAGDVDRNLRYLRACCRHAVEQGDIPFASHLFFTQFLDDTKQNERSLGIQMGYSFWQQAEQVVFYVDLGMSNGMKDALARCVLEDKPYQIRRLPKEAPAPQTDFIHEEPATERIAAPSRAGLAGLDALEQFSRGMVKNEAATQVPRNELPRDQ